MQKGKRTAVGRFLVLLTAGVAVAVAILVALTRHEAHRMPAIHGAALEGRVDDVKRLLSEDPELLHARDDADWTPLHRAVAWGRVEVVRVLLSRGADPNAQERSGWTPLHVAIRRDGENCKIITELLLRHGAQTDIRDGFGKTPLDLALSRGYEEIAEVLKQHGPKE